MNASSTYLHFDGLRSYVEIPDSPDFSVPTRDDLEQAVHNTIAYAQAGHHIVIHCSAGIGRTGLFTAYLAKRCLGLSGHEALQWIRHYIPRAVETPEQQRLVLHAEEL